MYFLHHRAYFFIFSNFYTCMHLYNIVKSVDDENETEDVQIGSLGSDLPNHIDRKMWAEEDKDNLEVLYIVIVSLP